jgi:transcriptional regulator with XRE-family HTH domain
VLTIVYSMKTELSLNFGKIIREFRKEKGISQEELAFRSNLHRTYIGMIERGEKNITLENIEKLSKGLDVSMKLIFEKLNKIHQ